MSDKTKRKEWVKTAAIIFLSVLLVLTFFSNTIKNYSLPEVAAQYTNSGTITNKVRGQGTVDAADPYSVIYKASRKVESVKVKVGDEVTKGDVLYTLEPSESDELRAAEKELKNLQNAYEKALITGQISSSVSNAVSNGTTGTTATKQAEIETLKNKIEKAESTVEAYEDEQLALIKQISVWSAATDTSIKEIKDLSDAKETESAWEKQKNVTSAAKESEQANVDRLQDNVDSLQKQLESVSDNDVSGSDLDSLHAEYNKASNDLREAQAKLAEATTNDNTATTKLAEWKNNVIELQKVIDKKVTELNLAKSNSESNMEVAKKNLAKLEEQLTELTGTYTTQFSLEEMIDAINDQKIVVEKLKAEENGNEVVAPVSGTILEMPYVAGETTAAGEKAASIQVAGKGYTLSMTLTQEQAKLISVGDEAEIINSWWYSDVHARVKSIKPDPSNPASSKIAVFELDGEVSAGQQLSLTVGKRSANYENIVPNSAIREDNNGKFILRVNSKSTPLGTRYIAERVNVTVLASDETQSAVSGDLMGWDYVITTSSKPIEDGTEVRLKD